MRADARALLAAVRKVRVESVPLEQTEKELRAADRARIVEAMQPFYRRVAELIADCHPILTNGEPLPMPDLGNPTYVISLDQNSGWGFSWVNRLVFSATPDGRLRCERIEGTIHDEPELRPHIENGRADGKYHTTDTAMDWLISQLAHVVEAGWGPEAVAREHAALAE
jgi:hypothetical protein